MLILLMAVCILSTALIGVIYPFVFGVIGDFAKVEFRVFLGLYVAH